MKKRGNGEGSVFEIRPGYYRGQITIGKTLDGKLKRKSVYGSTKKEVKDKMAQIRVDLHKGDYVESTNVTIHDYIKSLLGNDYAFGLVKESTYYRHLCSLQIIENSGIGRTPLQKCSKTLLNGFFSELTVYSDSTISKVYGLIRRCFREAYRDKLVKEDIALYLKKPKSKSKKEKTRALTLSEQQKLVDVLRSNKTIPYRSQMLLMLCTGMRMGEINALDINDYDPRFSAINIHRTCSRIVDRSRTVISENPKTDAGNRKIPLTAQAITILEEHLADRVDNPLNLLFYDNKEKQIISTNRVNKQLQRVFEKYDIIDHSVPGKVSLHSLRHTYATRCIEAGMTAIVLRDLLGHTDISVTLNTYAEAFEEFQRKNIDYVEEYCNKMNISI